MTGSGPQSAKKMTEEAKMRAKKAMFEEEIKMCEEHVVNDEKRLLSHPPCCIELLHKELLECIEFIGQQKWKCIETTTISAFHG